MKLQFWTKGKIGPKESPMVPICISLVSTPSQMNLTLTFVRITTLPLLFHSTLLPRRVGEICSQQKPRESEAEAIVCLELAIDRDI